MAYKQFQAGTTVPAQEVNRYLMNQSVIVFDDVAQRNSTITAPVEGMVVYLKDTNKTFQYDGANWLEVVKLDSAGRLFNTTQPRVLATQTVNQTGYVNASQVDLVIYNSVTFNIGSHYNSANGRFTAPVSGTYAFDASVISTGTNLLQFWFVVNGSRNTSFVLQGSGTVIAGGSIIYLNQNDWVGVSVWTNNTSTTFTPNSFHSIYRAYFLG